MAAIEIHGEELLPCLLCGGAAKLRSDGHLDISRKANEPIDATFWVKCANKNCSISPAATNSMKSAIEKWNLRTTAA